MGPYMTAYNAPASFPEGGGAKTERHLVQPRHRFVEVAVALRRFS
jgi:hypothetical protein